MRLRNIRRDMIVSSFRVLALKIRLGKRIEVGFDTRIGPNCRFVILKGAKVRLRGACLTRFVTLECDPNAILEIGDAWLGQGVIISARERVVIGDGSGVAEYGTIRDHNHVHAPGISLYDWQYTSAPVLIGNDVWLGSKVTVTAGVTIADHALCAAGAVVTKNVESWQRVGGVPARPLGKGGSPVTMDGQAAVTMARQASES